MRRLPLILGLTLIVAMTAWEVYRFFVTHEGIRYFSSEPRRLVLVILLGLAGGVVALGISRLSPGSQRTEGVRPWRLCVTQPWGEGGTTVAGGFNGHSPVPAPDAGIILPVLGPEEIAKRLGVRCPCRLRSLKWGPQRGRFSCSSIPVEAMIT